LDRLGPPRQDPTERDKCLGTRTFCEGGSLFRRTHLSLSRLLEVFVPVYLFVGGRAFIATAAAATAATAVAADADAEVGTVGWDRLALLLLLGVFCCGGGRKEDAIIDASKGIPTLPCVHTYSRRLRRPRAMAPPFQLSIQTRASPHRPFPRVHLLLGLVFLRACLPTDCHSHCRGRARRAG